MSQKILGLYIIIAVFGLAIIPVSAHAQYMSGAQFLNSAFAPRLTRTVAVSTSTTSVATTTLKAITSTATASKITPKIGKVLGASTFRFVSNLKKGINSDAVKQLQEKLRAEGYFTYPTSTGYFGTVTVDAVKAYQKAKGLPSTGFVGPLTIKELNK